MKHIGDILVAICFMVVIGGAGWYAISEDGSENHHNRFEGACQVQGGTVEGDLCIKDNRVILRLDDVK